MHKLDFTVALSKKFETVMAVWQSQAETRRLNAFREWLTGVIKWVKKENQSKYKNARRT